MAESFGFEMISQRVEMEEGLDETQLPGSVTIDSNDASVPPQLVSPTVADTSVDRSERETRSVAEEDDIIAVLEAAPGKEADGKKHVSFKRHVDHRVMTPEEKEADNGNGKRRSWRNWSGRPKASRSGRSRAGSLR